MSKENEPTKQPTVEEIQERFREWRGKNRRGARLPEELWEAAVELCRSHSVSYVGRLLHLDYFKLRAM